MAVLLGCSLATLTGCKDDDDDNPPTTTTLAEAKKGAVGTYGRIAFAAYSDALSAAQALDAKARDFVAAPTEPQFAELKRLWLAARAPYSQTEATRFYADSPVEAYEGEVNSWPMDENFVDYVFDAAGGVVTSGLINDPATYPVINTALIQTQNQNPDEKNVTAGYHAIEFLLWGQDRSATGPGERPWTDYVTGAGGTALNQARRGEYLLVCTGLLVSQLQAVAADWAPGNAANFRARFEAMPADSALSRIFLGLGSLSDGELASERIEPAYVLKAQEQEHSCFSDNTDEDIRLNQVGIENMLLGRYRRPDGTEISGPSLLAAIRAADGGRADAQLGATTLASTTTAAIANPFDQEFLGPDSAPGRVRLKAAIDALRAQATRLVASASSLGISLNL